MKIQQLIQQLIQHKFKFGGERQIKCFAQLSDLEILQQYRVSQHADSIWIIWLERSQQQ